MTDAVASAAAAGLRAGRRRLDAAMMGLCWASAAFGLAFLAWILGTLLWKGLAGLTPAVFTQPTPAPGSVGGLLNAIMGSLFLSFVAVGIGAPVGVLAGTWLSEYGRHSRFAVVVRFVNDVMLSAPSIVIGLFVYDLLVAPIGHFSAAAGAVALALIVLPVIVRSTENMLDLVPDTLREAGAAMGMPRSRVIRGVCWRAARAGLVTGALLAFLAWILGTLLWKGLAGLTPAVFTQPTPAP
ncbi:MAG: ABC transporter permease subunit, partial [Hyphomicrobiales bacterium]|nr:ABC transporter permease subunit [Hyphomicrobiales bacterium]